LKGRSSIASPRRATDGARLQFLDVPPDALEQIGTLLDTGS
jgi:hypothetical protein